MTAARSLLCLALAAGCTGSIREGAELPGAPESPTPGMTSAPGAPAAPGAPTMTPGAPDPAPTMNVPGALPPAAPAAVVPISCSGSNGPGPTPVRRLSRREYLNTLSRMVASSGILAYDNYESIVGKLAPLVPMVPPDLKDRERDFTTLDQSVASGHMDGYFMLAAAAAQALAADPAQLKRYAPCAAAPDAACVETFVKAFGLRALRRALTPEDVQRYRAIYDENAATPREGFEALIEAFLLAPQFLYQIETEGTAVAGRSDLVRISDYELASRLSYRLTWNMPSDELLAAARDGKLSNDAEYARWIDRLFTPPSSAPRPGDRLFFGYMSELGRVVDRFYAEWLDIKTPQFSSSGTFNKFMGEGGWSPLAWDVATSAPFIAEETRDFVYRLTWLEKGTVPDLFTNDSVTSNGRIRTFYNLPAATPDGMVVALPKRAGLITRASFLASGDEKSMPIQRGVKIRRKLLCDELPDPNPDALPDRSLVAPESSPTRTTRERYAEKTAPGTCQTCHALINALGFAMEDYDSLARNRTYEPIYEEKLLGKSTSVSRVGMPPIDAAVTGLNLTPGDGLSVNGAVALSQALAKSEKTTACYARQVFRFLNARRETPDDGCVLKAMIDGLAPGKGSLGDMWRQVPLQPEFKLKRVVQ